MKLQDIVGLNVAEAIEAFCDPETITAMKKAQAEAARLEDLDRSPGSVDLMRGRFKVAAYSEAAFYRIELCQDLQRRLTAGELIATARERPASPRIDVPTSAWRHLLPEPSDGSARHGTGSIELYDVRVSLAGPAETGAMPEPEELTQPLASADVAPLYSVVVLRSWYRLRCASWPSTTPPPSEPDDRAAASKHFGRTVPRAALRTIRRELAPAHWLKPGPRKARR